MLAADGPDFAADPMAAKEMLALMAAVAEPEGQARALGGEKLVTNFLDTCVALAASQAGTPEAEEMKLLVEQIRQAIADDQPEVLTLEKVYGKWSDKKAAGEELGVGENPVVVQHLQFVLDYTEEYGKEPLADVASGLGLEFSFGCKCFQLLYELEPNCAPLNERNVCQLLLTSAARQKNDFAGQCAVEAANDAVQYPENAEVWAQEAQTAVIVADVLNRGRQIRTENETREQMLATRLQLAERVAMTRTYFNNTECMNALVGLWDDYDGGKYSVDLLKQVFKTMRRIINDHWVAVLLKNNVPQRLIDVINDKQARVDLLPDVLFLLAALAVVPEIKTLVGELKGVEACLDLLVRSMKNPDHAAVSPVLTNDCLALSAITLGHGSNLQRFINTKGVELNIQAMSQTQNNGKLDFDVANAASLLMCNTCFKRDELKELYGKLKACEAVMKAINQYDGSEDVKAFRCISTMFKAIGNLALWTPNVDIFMAGKIHQTFAHLYQKSDRLPDSLVESSLRTLSNLAMENTTTNMVSFGITLPPILYMLKQEQRCSIRMFTLAFDVLGALCRHPDNSKRFLQEGGIPTCLRILNSYSDAYMYANGIHVLGIQTTNPASVPELVRNGVFNFLTSVLENQASAEEPNTDLAVSGCRCIRRLLVSKDNGNKFISAGGVVQVVALMKSMPSEHTMVHLECHRTLINMLALFPPPAPVAAPAAKNGPVDDWEDEVADEGVLPTVETIQRPGGPRSWESIEMDAESIKAAIYACARLLEREEALRQNRLLRGAVGVLAYFACEKIPGIVDCFYDGNVTASLALVFTQQDVDDDVVKSCCYIINNVAYASEPEKYLQLRKDRDMRRNLDVANQKLGSGAKPFCELTLKLLNERSADPSRFEIHQQWTYPLEITQWNKDKYPNGVQDLPNEWKEELRAGGKLKTITSGKEKEVLHWKSSMDLECLQWRIDPKEGPYKHSIAISRVCSIARGLRSTTLQHAHEIGSPTSKPREGESIVLRGLPCEDFPDGVEINILCGTKRSRDKFFELITEWREAAAFGF
ncbi:putative anonymous antigen-1 [Gregarina niphandrodes]|uniref:Anonymous antigen-1 n=1 Tax=Gregarina niphandrodes TaxID=110365 RepID=A0A023B8M5_GRENI|nr:putative anonymous antigen-1 [Gregarina niphandrodes]EZG69329.1 putative anonymous antigen-1 [Gregarina niphandrodes]|eukprot:XP_011134446.1 putative anonymous antigen-1 [Gregarina niphandrodes]